MRRVLLFMGAFFLCSFAHSQIINENAAWPNGSWALNGTYDNASLLANPTADANFSYDDDNAGSGSTDILDAESNVIDISSAVSGGETFLTVTFDYNYNFGSTFDLEWFDADASTWTTWDAIADNSSTTSDWCGNISGSFTSSELDVAAFTATQQSGFQYRLHYDASSVFGWGFCIASPTITSSAPPSCPDPSSLTASNITDMSADFDWTQGGSAVGFTLEVCPDGTPAGDPSCISTSTGTLGGTVTVNGLNAYTAYDAYITEDCGGNGTSSVVGPEEFATSGPDPICGGKYYDTGGPTGQYSNDEDVSYLICPDVGGEVVTLTFNSFNTEASFDFLKIFDGDDSSAPALHSGNGFNGTTTPGPFTSTAASGCLFVRFTSDGSATRDGWDADVTCAPPPACPNPSNLTASNITDMSADFDWTTGGSATGFTLEVCPDGTPAGDPSCITTTTGTIGGTVNVSGLTPSTDYDAYLTEDCGGANGQSSTIGPIDITTNVTPPANDECANATSLNVEGDLSCSNPVAGSTDGATESLAACAGGVAWDVWYSFEATGANHSIIINNTSGSTDIVTAVYDACGGNEITCQDTPNSPINLSGLTSGNTYYFRIFEYQFSGTPSVTEFEVCVGTPPPPPGNDDCGGATDILSLPYSNTQDASSATQSSFATTCSGMNDGVWYTMDGTGCDVTVTVSPDAWDPELDVYSGSCGSLTCVDNADSFGTGGSESVTFYAEVGTTYYFNIGYWSSGTNGSEGPFDISVECCDALSTVAEPSSTATLTQANSCTETNGFTYYSDGTNNIFAIDWDPSDIGGGHNSAAKTGVSITVTTNAPGVATDNPSGQGTWTMQTYWNVDAPALDGPVSIKFFYNPIDKDATDDAAANSGLGPIETPTWFKTVGVDFDPANITAGSVGQGSIPLSASIGTENGATFARFDNITSFSGGTYAAGVGVSGQSVLPIDLLSIDAQAVKDGNQITWTTAREQNVEVHIIEKSKDGRTWDVLQEVDAKNSPSKTSYRIVDEDPYYMTHYRLSSRDNDGSQYISGYASVERSGENDLSVFPNPFAGSLRLSANSTIEQNISIQITDLQGRVLITDYNTLTVGRQEIKIDTESLPSGVYLIHINGESISSTEKIVKY